MLSFGLIERSPAPRPGAVSGKKARAADTAPASRVAAIRFAFGARYFAGGFEPMAHPTSTKPTNISEQYGRLQFNKRLRRSMVRKRFATRRSSETSRREAMKP